jgi:hypothetical protein
VTLLLSLLLAAAASSAPVDPAALAQGALACRGIPDEVAAAERRIIELGWPRVRRRDDGPVLAFERDGMLLVLAPPDGQGHTLSCGVLATVRRSVSAADVAAAVSAAFGRQPGPGDADGSPVWELDGGQVAVVMFDGEGRVLFNFWYPRTTAR